MKNMELVRFCCVVVVCVPSIFLFYDSLSNVSYFFQFDVFVPSLLSEDTRHERRRRRRKEEKRQRNDKIEHYYSGKFTFICT
jgi:uridine kinase